jgi:hypothetical protein
LVGLGKLFGWKIRWIRQIGTLKMTSESISVPDPYVTCGDCAEQNKQGSVRCARCGADLPTVEGVAMDPELRSFNAAQAELAEKIQRERRKTVMIDILLSSGSEFKPKPRSS